MATQFPKSHASPFHHCLNLPQWRRPTAPCFPCSAQCPDRALLLVSLPVGSSCLATGHQCLPHLLSQIQPSKPQLCSSEVLLGLPNLSSKAWLAGLQKLSFDSLLHAIIPRLGPGSRGTLLCRISTFQGQSSHTHFLAACVRTKLHINTKHSCLERVCHHIPQSQVFNNWARDNTHKASIDIEDYSHLSRQ